MGRNNKDFDKDRIPSINVNEALSKQKTLEEHDRNKGNWRVALQQEHGRSVESQDRAEAALRKAGEL